MGAMIKFLRRFKKSTAAPSPAAALTPAPVVARPEIPRYPPFRQGLPLVASAQVAATQAELIRKLRYAVGCTPEQYEEWVCPVVDRYVAYVHLLPASEAHHHRGAGGLLHHGLEVGFLAGQASAGKVFAMDREPRERVIHEPLWRLAATLAGLCHDIGKPLSDLSVTDRDGTVTWSPMQETIPQWAARHQVDSYFLHWRDRQHNRHASAGMMVLERILGPETIERLYGADPAIMNALVDAVAGQQENATLTVLVRNADAASVARDLKDNRIDPEAHSLGVPIERYLIDAMARLVRDGTWRINTPGARLWMLAGGLHVVWPQGGDEIVALLAADRVPGIPRHPDTLADILIERGTAVPPGEGDGVRRYWRLAPAILAQGAKPVTLTLLRLSSPGLVLSGAVPETVALSGEPAVRAAVPSGTSALIQPVAATPGAWESGPLAESPDDEDPDAPAQDSAFWAAGEEAPPEPLVTVPGAANDQAPAADPLFAAAIQQVIAGRRASILDLQQHLKIGYNRAARLIEAMERSGIVGPEDANGHRDVRVLPSAPPAVASGPVVRARPVIASPTVRRPPAPQAPSPETAVRQAALAWFQAAPHGSGGRLLLAVAAAIAAGERVAADLLYLSGVQVWVRVPQGLDGFGAAVEDQVTALWDGDLLTVNPMQPYVRVQEIEGLPGCRGVNLKAEAGSYFRTLLSPAVVASFASPGTAAPQPAAGVAVGSQPELSGAARPASPTDRPTPTAAPPVSSPAATPASPAPRLPATAPAHASRPLPTETAGASPEPTAMTSASAVADALLASVRAERAQESVDPGGEGQGLLTAADLALAAATAGINPQTLRRVLMRRPGCRMTPDGGVNVA